MEELDRCSRQVDGYTRHTLTLQGRDGEQRQRWELAPSGRKPEAPGLFVLLGTEQACPGLRGLWVPLFTEHPHARHRGQ